MPLPAMAALAIALPAIVPIIVIVLGSFGFGIVVYTGVDAAIEQAYQYIQQQTSALPADLLTIFAKMNLDKYISMLFAAYTTRLAIKGMGASGQFSKWFFGGLPGGS